MQIGLHPHMTRLADGVDPSGYEDYPSDHLGHDHQSSIYSSHHHYHFNRGSDVQHEIHMKDLGPDVQQSSQQQPQHLEVVTNPVEWSSASTASLTRHNQERQLQLTQQHLLSSDCSSGYDSMNGFSYINGSSDQQIMMTSTVENDSAYHHLSHHLHHHPTCNSHPQTSHDDYYSKKSSLIKDSSQQPHNSSTTKVSFLNPDDPLIIYDNDHSTQRNTPARKGSETQI